MHGCSQAAPSPSSASITQQLCSSLLRLYKTTIAWLSATGAPSEQAPGTADSQAQGPAAEQQHPDQAPYSQPPPAKHTQVTETAQQQPEEASATHLQEASVPSTSQSALMAILEFALETCKAFPPRQTTELAALLTLYLSACQLLHKQGDSIPLGALDAFLGSPLISQLE